MNFNRWYAKEEVDNVVSDLEVYDEYRATFEAKSKGIIESRYAWKKRMRDTNTYCYNQGKSYDVLLKLV